MESPTLFRDPVLTGAVFAEAGHTAAFRAIRLACATSGALWKACGELTPEEAIAHLLSSGNAKIAEDFANAVCSRMDIPCPLTPPDTASNFHAPVDLWAGDRCAYVITATGAVFTVHRAREWCVSEQVKFEDAGITAAFGATPVTSENGTVISGEGCTWLLSAGECFKMDGAVGGFPLMAGVFLVVFPGMMTAVYVEPGDASHGNEIQIDSAPQQVEVGWTDAGECFLRALGRTFEVISVSLEEKPAPELEWDLVVPGRTHVDGTHGRFPEPTSLGESPQAESRHPCCRRGL